MIWILITFMLGIIYANAIEWFIHKYALHNMGKKKGSFFAFHWNSHHQKSRKNGFIDDDYHTPLFKTPVQLKEFGMLIAGILLHLPLLWVLPGFFFGAAVLGLSYFPLHKMSHLDAEWCKKWMPWHYDHHMGRNQDANWCVTFPLFDHVMGTRIKYEYDERGIPSLAKTS